MSVMQPGHLTLMLCNTWDSISGIHIPSGFPVVTGTITITLLLSMRCIYLHSDYICFS